MANALLSHMAQEIHDIVRVRLTTRRVRNQLLTFGRWIHCTRHVAGHCYDAGYHGAHKRPAAVAVPVAQGPAAVAAPASLMRSLCVLIRARRQVP